jgi:arylsulfatase A-like enzyme
MEVDQAIAALLTDLESCGLLDDTLILWGGGVKPGIRYGETDDYGYYAVKDKVHLHDLHATMLHLLGLDHLKLTYKFAGRDFRLTDVHGEVVSGLLA